MPRTTVVSDNPGNCHGHVRNLPTTIFTTQTQTEFGSFGVVACFKVGICQLETITVTLCTLSPLHPCYGQSIRTARREHHLPNSVGRRCIGHSLQSRTCRPAVAAWAAGSACKVVRGMCLGRRFARGFWHSPCCNRLSFRKRLRSLKSQDKAAWVDPRDSNQATRPELSDAPCTFQVRSGVVLAQELALLVWAMEETYL